MNYCPYCGKKIVANAKFCKNCGKSLIPNVQAANNATIQNTVTKPKKNKTFVIVLVSLVLLLIAGIAATLFIKYHKKQDAVVTQPSPTPTEESTAIENIVEENKDSTVPTVSPTPTVETVTNTTVSKVTNWEELAEKITEGYWLVLSDVETEHNLIKQFKTMNLGLDTDIEKDYADYCLTCVPDEYNTGEKRGIVIGRDCYILEKDNPSAKKVNFVPAKCTDFFITYRTIDYSQLEEGILTHYCTDYYIKDGVSHVYTEVYHHYDTEEEAKNNIREVKKDKIVLGGVSVNVDNLRIRKNPNTDAEIVGKTKKNDDYQVTSIVMDGTYTWYCIGEEQWIADDGTWLNYTSNY